MNSLEEVFSKNKLPKGRCIAPSKSTYRKKNQHSFFIPNALIFDEQEYNKNKETEPLWHGDLDLVKDSKPLRNICEQSQTSFKITSEYKQQKRIMRPTEKIYSPQVFAQLLEKERLGELKLRKDYEVMEGITRREIGLDTLWKTIFQQSLATSKVSPDEITSVVLFGSVVNKAPYQMREGKEHSFWRWTWKEKPLYEHTPYNDIDVLVLTTGRKENIVKEATMLDIGYPSYTELTGNIDVLYTSVDNFIKKAEKQTENTTNILRDGIILADDGTFQEISKPFEERKEQKYILEWRVEDKYDNPGFLGSPSIIKQDVLHGKLDFVGFIPYIFNE